MCILLYYTVDNVVLVYSCDLVSHFDFLFTTNRRRIGQQDGHTTNNYTYKYNYTLLFLLCVFFLYRISMKKWQCVCLAIVMLQWIWKHFPFLSGDPVQFKKRFHWTYADEMTNEHHRHYYYYNYYKSAMFIWKQIWIMYFLYRTQVNVCIAISKGKRKLNSQSRMVIYPNRTCVH